jgi:hypothetical protein
MMDELQTKLSEYIEESIKPGYRRHHTDRALQGLLGIVLNHRLPAPVRDSLLMMTHFEYGPVRQGAMQVQLKDEAIYLRVDLDMIDAIVRMKAHVAGDIIDTELANLFHHEMAHILLGHLDGPKEEFLDPIMTLAKEIAVNDGWLRLGPTIYPFVRLGSLTFYDRVMEYSEDNPLPKDWLQHYYKVYKALAAVAPRVSLIARSKLGELWEELKPEQIHDLAPGPDQMLVLVVYDEGEATVYPVVIQEPGDNSLLRDIHEAVRHELLDSGLYQYDHQNSCYRYSPEGFSEHERVIRMKSYRVPWHMIRRLFGVKRVLGYDRRRGHLYPPDEAPLVTRRFERKCVYVFYDSSGSIPDEVLSKFIGTVRTSPFRVVEKYFSTQISDKPHTGGTDFKCIEEHLLSLDTYPDTVVVLTDGYAEANFKPKYPERWYWIVKGSIDVPTRIGGTVIEITEQESFV